MAVITDLSYWVVGISGTHFKQEGAISWFYLTLHDVHSALANRVFWVWFKNIGHMSACVNANTK